MPATMTLREQKKSRTRDALVETALRLFAAQGFEATTVDQIAAEAEISRRTFFRYFTTKEAVVFPYRAEQLERFGRLACHRAPGETPFQAVRRATLEMAREYMDDQYYYVAQYRLVQSSSSLIAYELELDREWEAAIADALLDDGGADAVARRRARVLAGAAMGVIRATLHEWFTGNGRSDLVTLGEDAFDLLEHGTMGTSTT